MCIGVSDGGIVEVWTIFSLPIIHSANAKTEGIFIASTSVASHARIAARISILTRISKDILGQYTGKQSLVTSVLMHDA